MIPGSSGVMLWPKFGVWMMAQNSAAMPNPIPTTAPYTTPSSGSSIS